MAELIDKWEVVNKLIELENWCQQNKPFDGFRNAHLYQKICQLEISIGKTEGLRWIPVAERLPGKEEYTAKAEDGTEYYVRLLIAYKTDIIEYEIGYYDGYKWMTEMPIRIINDVVAWMPFPNLPQPPKGE